MDASKYDPYTTIQMLCAGGRAGRCYPRSINESADRC